MKAAIGFVVAVGLLLAACGGESDATAAQPTATAASTVAADTAGASPTTAAPTPTPAPREKAEDALKRQMEYLTKGQTGRAYDELHPLQQAFISRELYMRCTTDAAGLEMTGFRVLETYQEETPIAGAGVTATSTAVTVRLTFRTNGREQEMTDTFREFNVDGQWRFSVAGDGDMWKAGRCP